MSIPVNALSLDVPNTSISLPRRTLHIALLGYRSHPHVGGQGIYLHYLSKALVARGHKVDVISGPPYPDLIAGVNLIKLPSLDLYAHPNPHRALQWRHLTSFTDLYEWWSKLSGSFAEPYCFGRRVAAYIKKHKPRYDIIHDNQSLCYGLLALQKQGYPVVVTVHHPITQDRALAINAATSRRHAWLIKRWYDFIGMQLGVVKKLSHIVTVSKQSQQDIAEDFSVATSRITVIGNGVDTDIFKPLPNISPVAYRIITTASSDQPLKGLSILLQAIARIKEQYPQIKLHVIGKLNPEGATQKELIHLNLCETVEFISGISTQELVEQYARASIAVVPSLYEGFGLPAAEALACAKPLICSDGGALPEVVGNAALNVAAGDVQQMTDALIKLLDDDESRKALAVLAREHSLNQLSWTHVAQLLETYYYTVIDGTLPQ